MALPVASRASTEAAAAAARPAAPAAAAVATAAPSSARHPAWGWALFVAAWLLLPLVFDSDFARSVIAKAGIAVVFALSYNMLLGQGGMLSFGHAIYSGLGGYLTIHALAAVNAGRADIPVSLLPLVGGAAGMGFAVVLGWVSTRRAGTTFAMISLGIAELVAASVLMVPAFFGGEAGVAANRVTGPVRMGIDFGSQLQMDWLIAAWALGCVAAMQFITRTPFGRLANAVRDNPERVAFVGYSTHLVRWQVIVLSGLFAGISGGLAAINNEIVTIETVGAHASGLVLLMVFIGGIAHFGGPVVGAVVVTLMQTVLAAHTRAWLFYFGLLFLLMVLFAPQGAAGLWKALAAWLRPPGAWRRALPALASGALAGALMLAAAVTAVECAYRLWGGGSRSPFEFAGWSVDPAAASPWIAAAVLFAAGFAMTQATRRIAERHGAAA